MWLGLWVMLKYRTKNNYCNGLYLFGRLFDKAVFTFLTATFYLWVGKTNTAANVPNIGGLLFLWCAWALQQLSRHACAYLKRDASRRDSRFYAVLGIRPASGLACDLLPTKEGERDCLFCRVVLPAYGAGPYLPAIVMERPVYVREMSDGLYSPLTYLLYKVGTWSVPLQVSCHCVS